MFKKDILNQIREIFEKYPTIEVVIKDILKFKSNRYHIHGYSLIWGDTDMIVTPYEGEREIHWWVDMMRCKKDELITIRRRAIKSAILSLEKLSKDDIINIIKYEGNEGAEAVEKYFNVDDGNIVDDELNLAQLCYFSDTNELLAYLLDEDYNGYWKTYEELSEVSKAKLENKDFWAFKYAGV